MKTTKLVLLTTALVLSAVGCSDSGQPSPKADPGQPAAKSNPPAGNEAAAQLQFWDMVWGPPEYIDTAKALVDQFNKEHPNIKVNYQSTPWNNWYQTFTSAIAAGTAPDISTGAGYQAFQFSQMGAILPIDDVIDDLKKNGKLDDFLPNTADLMKYDGHYVSLPWAIDIRVPYYRKDLFEKAGVTPPKTWDELRTVAKKLSGGGKYGMVMPGDTGGTHYVFSFMFNNNGGLFTKDKKIDFTNARNTEAIQFLSDMVKDGSINPAGSGFTGDDATKSFGQGDAAIIIKNPGFPAQLPELKDKIGLMDPLTGPHGDKGTIFWVNNIMLYKQSKHPKEAKEFLKWWSDNNKPLWLKGHVTQLPVRKTFTEDPYFTNDPERKEILEKWIPIGKTTAYPYPAVFPELNEIEGEGVMQTMTQEIMLGKNPKSIMDKADKTMKSIMKEK
ncbi:sugar ABC transporter substrate-binding protein [Paenibacillus filicis]|uniref:Sugar ABC transporter substrate-binding protein n=1 Tax=Paenibacillus gyeongsangnamensis TaxID=3388067 RepID=A0ABT4QF31_9BACL|nr:sugar ABC transporter substrate-binding protein [Paenibacillus filicis]MCZ8515487.1 sugar ABC transporter substrate-binding protein [Paenibacillus filicis]